MHKTKSKELLVKLCYDLFCPWVMTIKKIMLAIHTRVTEFESEGLYCNSKTIRGVTRHKYMLKVLINYININFVTRVWCSRMLCSMYDDPNCYKWIMIFFLPMALPLKKSGLPLATLWSEHFGVALLMWKHICRTGYAPDNDTVCFKSMLQSKLIYSM